MIVSFYLTVVHISALCTAHLCVFVSRKLRLDMLWNKGLEKWCWHFHRYMYDLCVFDSSRHLCAVCCPHLCVVICVQLVHIDRLSQKLRAMSYIANFSDAFQTNHPVSVSCYHSLSLIP